MSGTDYVSAINVHICRSVVPGSAGGHVPGRSAAYENSGNFKPDGSEATQSARLAHERARATSHVIR